MIIISLIIIAAAVIADQAAKIIVVKSIELGNSISILKFGSHKMLSFTYVRNTGAAWSSFSDKTSLLTLVTVVIIAAMLLLMYVKPVSQKIFDRNLNKVEFTAFSLITAGGIGNIIDRIRLKYVVDFIKTDFIDFPVFNIADMCVVIGCIILMIDVIVTDSADNKKKKSVKENTEENTSTDSDGNE